MFPRYKKLDMEVVPSYTDSPLEMYPEYTLPNVTRIDSKGNEITVYTGDIYNLFNQKRFAGVAQNIIDSIRSNILATGSQYQSVLDGLSDDELFAAVKPRSIQSPSELMDYSKRVMSYLDARLSQITLKEDETSTLDETNNIPNSD